MLSCDGGETFILNEVRIEKWVYGGAGLARLRGDASSDLAGRVILAPYLLPGESARIDVHEDVRADLVEVLDASPDRVTPPCPHFGTCGGCHYQHAPYQFQLDRKVEILREQLRRVGKIDYAGEIDVVSGPAWGYRNRAQFRIQRESGRPGRIGYLAARSHELVALPGDCPVASPGVNRTLAMLRERLEDPRFPRFLHSVEVFTNESDVQINVLDADRPVARPFYEWCGSSAALEYPTSLGSFRVSPRSFFQVNRFLVERLVDHALADSTGATALDLYAGVGLFSVPLAKKFSVVTAVEASSSAARNLDFNVVRSGAGVRIETGRADEYLASLDHAPDFVLADPPRAGLGKTVVAHLVRLAPPRLTIVSCDPSTLARDLAGLRGYRIERLVLVDLFPQTYHLETIAALSRA